MWIERRVHPSLIFSHCFLELCMKYLTMKSGSYWGIKPAFLLVFREILIFRIFLFVRLQNCWERSGQLAEPSPARYLPTWMAGPSQRTGFSFTPNKYEATVLYSSFLNRERFPWLTWRLKACVSKNNSKNLKYQFLSIAFMELIRNILKGPSHQIYKCLDMISIKSPWLGHVTPNIKKNCKLSF